MLSNKYLWGFQVKPHKNKRYENVTLAFIENCFDILLFDEQWIKKNLQISQ